MTPEQYDKVASIIGGYGRQLPDWEELREADQATLGAMRLEAASTVTVATRAGADVLLADKWQVESAGAGRGELKVFRGAELAGEYGPSHWLSAVRDAHRARPEADGRPATADLEAVLCEIEAAAYEGEGSDWERVTEVRAILGHYRKAGK